jgi:hypothetical protein
MIEFFLLAHDFRSARGAKSDVCYGTRAMSDDVLGEQGA